MILSQISYLDCVAFLVFLTPQLLIHVGLVRTLTWLIPALPSLSELSRTRLQQGAYTHSLSSLPYPLSIYQGAVHNPV